MTTTAKVGLAGTDSTYTLTPSDKDTFNALVRAQGYIGAAQSSVGQTQLWNFFGVIREITYDHYRLSNSAQLKSWMDDVLQVVTGTKTNYAIDGKNVTGAGMFLIYMYYQFSTCCDEYGWPAGDTGNTGFPAGYYRNGGTWLPQASEGLPDAVPWNWFGPLGVSIFQAPNTVSSFYNTLGTDAILLNHDVATKKGSTPTIAIVSPGPANTIAQVQQFQQSRFDPANWTNSGDFVTAFAGCSLWQDQKTALKTLANATDMDSGSYLFILYLIMALSASNVTDQQLVQKVANTVTSSMEYANDTFMNQLVYLILMQMADPLGDFGYDNTQMKNQLNNFINAIVVSNAASAIVLKSLQNHFKILTSDASYPMQDPYNPNIGFDTRQTDTIAALDQARATMSL